MKNEHHCLHLTLPSCRLINSLHRSIAASQCGSGQEWVLSLISPLLVLSLVLSGSLSNQHPFETPFLLPDQRLEMLNSKGALFTRVNLFVLRKNWSAFLAQFRSMRSS